MAYRVAIKDTETGEVRVTEFPYEDDDLFWWTDGNFGCDCNRWLTFERAGGNEPDLDDMSCNEGPNRYLANCGSFLKEFDE